MRDVDLVASVLTLLDCCDSEVKSATINLRM